MPYADLSDVRCYYELLGTGDPMLLIPGLGATCMLWECVADPLSRSFSLIMVDNRGVGRSISTRAPQTLADLVVDLVELLDYLELDRAHVVGLSLGGMLAQQLAIDHPGRVDRLVLISCTHRFSPYLREMAVLLGQALRHFPRDVFLRTVELLGTSPEYLDGHAAEVERKIELAGRLGISRAVVARQLRCLGYRDVADGGAYHIESPTLVIAGDRDMLIPGCYAKRMAERIDRSEFMLVENCGHNPLVEQPEVVVPRIIEFLSGAAPGAVRGGEELHSALEEMS